MNISHIKKGFSIIFEFFANRLNFCVFYFSAALLLSIPSITIFVRPAMKLCFLWSIALIVWDFFTKRNMFKSYKAILLVLFMLSYFISIITNTEILYEGIKHFIYSAALVFLFYPFEDKISVEKQKKYLIAMNDIFAIVTFAVSLASIVMFVLRISYIFNFENNEYGQGVMYNRLYGLYISANPGALMSTCAFFLSIVTFFLNKEHFRKFKAFYIINNIVQFVFYTLTLSNGGYIAWIAGLAAISIFFAFPFFKKRANTIISITLAAVVFAASFAAFEGASALSRKGMVALSTFVSRTVAFVPENLENPGTNTGDEETPVILERVEGDKEINNGRVSIWSAGIAALKQKPLFGWADCRFYNGEQKIISVNESLLTDFQISELIRCKGYMHNAVIQILVCSGVVGLLFFVLFAAFVGIKYLISLFNLYKTPYYYSFAAVFLFIAIMLSQMAAESHFFFTHQDPYACAFWFYLGFGIRLINQVKKDSATGFAFVCDTPLQVLNSISFVLSDEQATPQNSDLYIYHQFRGSEELSERIRDSGIFRNVYDFGKLPYRGKILNKLCTFFRVTSPHRTLKKICNNSKCLKNNYNTLVLCFYTPFTDVFLCHYRPNEVLQLEDGIGTYITPDMEKRYRSRMFELANQYLLGGRLSYNAQALYLNSPALLQDHALPIKKLKNFASSKEKLEQIKKVYGFKEDSPYKENKIVYMTQPLNESLTAKLSEPEALSLLEGLSPVLRVHPRQSTEKFNGKIDITANLWELECAENITDEHVLIGAFSTAQLSPKMMFDREPTIIFLHKLYGHDFDNASILIERIKSVYKDKSKVITVETLDELKEITDRIKV